MGSKTRPLPVYDQNINTVDFVGLTERDYDVSSAHPSTVLHVLYKNLNVKCDENVSDSHVNHFDHTIYHSH